MEKLLATLLATCEVSSEEEDRAPLGARVDDDEEETSQVSQEEERVTYLR